MRMQSPQASPSNTHKSPLQATPHHIPDSFVPIYPKQNIHFPFLLQKLYNFADNWNIVTSFLVTPHTPHPVLRPGSVLWGVRCI